MKTVKLAYYNRQDWDQLINIIDVKENMHKKWEDWKQAFDKLKTELVTNGFEIIEVVINLETLIEYCKRNGLKNTGATRSKFVQQI